MVWREILKNYTLKFRIKFLECTGGILEFLEFFWSSFGVLLEFFWSSSGVLLEFFESFSGVILDLNWSSSGILLECFWSSSEVLEVGFFFEVSGVVLEFL